MPRLKEYIRLSVISKKMFIDIIQDMAERVLKEVGVGDDKIFWVCLALREAVINAMKHGNKFHPKKYVHINILFSKDALVMRVRDEGQGFNPENISNPLDDKNLLKPSGRGIFYIRSFMDEVNFICGKNGGMEVEMIKALSSIKEKKEG